MSQTIPSKEAVTSTPARAPTSPPVEVPAPPPGAATEVGGSGGVAALLQFLLAPWLFLTLFFGRRLGIGLEQQDNEREQVEAAVARRRRQGGPVRKALMSLASLRLTVILFALSMVLVFVGTLAQRDAGIWTVVHKYFRWWWVWVPLQVFFPSSIKVGGSFPFVGGWTIGTLLMINVVAAHTVRFRYTIRRAGIVLIHAGLIVLMSGELITGLFAVEGNMTIRQGGYANYAEIRENVELAFVTPAADPKKEHHVVIPEGALRKGGRITNDELPFDVEVVKYMVNSKRAKLEPKEANLASAGYGTDIKVVELPEVSGTDPNQTRDLASAYVRLYKKGTDEVIDTYLVSIWFSAVPDLAAQKVSVGDKGYDLSLRFKRAYKPYTVHLHKFRHDLYPGTNTPKNFSSEVQLIDRSRDVDRNTVISMNNPLRYEGETFFQASFLENDEGTILQVVRNPGWLLPYVSCSLVALGLVIHFGTYLVIFLRRRAA
jgi:hypothetical protein